MRNGQIRARLFPQCGGSFTRLVLCGALPTALPKWELRRLIERLSLFSGYPIECVLSVDKEAASWCEWWSELLVGMPERQIELVYRQVRGMRGDNREGR